MVVVEVRRWRRCRAGGVVLLGLMMMLMMAMMMMSMSMMMVRMVAIRGTSGTRGCRCVASAVERDRVRIGCCRAGRMIGRRRLRQRSSKMIGIAMWLMVRSNSGGAGGGRRVRVWRVWIW